MAELGERGEWGGGGGSGRHFCCCLVEERPAVRDRVSQRPERPTVVAELGGRGGSGRHFCVCVCGCLAEKSSAVFPPTDPVVYPLASDSGHARREGPVGPREVTPADNGLIVMLFIHFHPLRPALRHSRRSSADTSTHRRQQLTRVLQGTG